MAKTYRQSGFTIVELMMSLAVLAVGVTGIIAMQKVTAMSNLHSKSVAVATQIANAWQDQLLTDGTLWRRSSGLATTAWLSNVTSQTNWFEPTFNVQRGFGAAFDALGNPVAPANIAQAQFCVHLWLRPVLAVDGSGNDTIRASVRVLWPRVQAVRAGSGAFCGVGSDAVTLGNDTANYHSVYQTVAVRVHP